MKEEKHRFWNIMQIKFEKLTKTLNDENFQQLIS